MSEELLAIVRAAGVVCFGILQGIMGGDEVSGGQIFRTEPARITAFGREDAQEIWVCEVVLSAVTRIEACGLTQSSPIKVHVVGGPIESNPDCLGVFHCTTNEILILDPDRLSNTLGTDHPLGVIPEDLLFGSLLTHELTHAIVYQARGGPAPAIAEEEYVAYAMQFQFLSDENRKLVLQRFPATERQASLSLLNNVKLTFSPTLFGALAWRHFEEQEDGCEFVRRILRGEIRFPTGIPAYETGRKP